MKKKEPPISPGTETDALRGVRRLWDGLQMFEVRAVREDGSLWAASLGDAGDDPAEVYAHAVGRHVMALQDGPLLRLRPADNRKDRFIASPRPGDRVCSLRDPERRNLLQQWFVPEPGFEELLELVRPAPDTNRDMLLERLSAMPGGEACWTVARIVVLDLVRDGDRRTCAAIAEAIHDPQLGRRWARELGTPGRRLMQALNPASFLAPVASLLPGSAVALASGALRASTFAALVVAVVAVQLSANLTSSRPDLAAGGRGLMAVLRMLAAFASLCVGWCVITAAAGGTALWLVWTLLVACMLGVFPVDVAAAAAFGPLAGVATSYVALGHASGTAVVLSVPVGLAAAVLPMLDGLGNRGWIGGGRTLAGAFGETVLRRGAVVLLAMASASATIALLVMAVVGVVMTSAWPSLVVALVACVASAIGAAGAGEALCRPPLTRQLGRAVWMTHLLVALLAASLASVALVA